jgi:hypothetical protein
MWFHFVQILWRLITLWSISLTTCSWSLDLKPYYPQGNNKKESMVKGIVIIITTCDKCEHPLLGRVLGHR